MNRPANEGEKGLTTLELLAVLGIAAMCVIATISVVDQSAWKKRCEEAGGAPIIDRTGTRVCFGRQGGVLDVK